MLDFLKLQFHSFVSLINSGVFTSWYAYLIYALFIGKLFVLLKLDDLIWKFFSSFDMKYNEFNYQLFNSFDVILDGATWWLAINEIFINLNYKFIIVFTSSLMLKIFFGRKKPIKNGPPEPILLKDINDKYSYQPFEKDYSKNNSDSWLYVFNRPFDIKRLYNDLFKWSYPSVHLTVLLSFVLFCNNTLGFILLLICGSIWKLVSNRNWTSDLIASVFLVLFFKQLL
jgi:hypothetical protein